MMKRFLKVIYNLVKLVILCIPFVFNYFGNKKMGMHRYLIAKTHNMESTIFTPHVVVLIKVAAILILIFAVLYALKKNKRVYVLLISSIAFVAIIFGSNFIASKVYYFYIICFGLVNILSLADMLIGLTLENRKRGSLL